MHSRLVLLTFLDGPSGNYPDNALPGGPPNYPSQGLPGYPVDPGFGRPGYSPVDPGYGQGHPRPPHISGGPVFPPVGPDNSLPDDGSAPPPQIQLPIILPPSGIKPGDKYELKYSVRFGWVIVSNEVAEPK